MKIYEAHVGIATSEYKVGTYLEFAQNIVPRIVKLGIQLFLLNFFVIT